MPVYACMSVCVYVSKAVTVSVCVYSACLWVWVYGCVSAFGSGRMCLSVAACVCIFMCVFAYVCLSLRLCLCLHACGCMCVCMCL